MARIYADLLKDVGVLPKSKVVETSGAALVANGGSSELKKQLEELKDGGVCPVALFFVKYAYSGSLVASLCSLSEHFQNLIRTFLFHTKQLEELKDGGVCVIA